MGTGVSGDDLPGAAYGNESSKLNLDWAAAHPFQALL
jgi:hypothetical protein